MAGGFGGTYLASVVDNDDPMAQGRLSVIVPDVTYDATWAAPCQPPSSIDLPAIGDEVMISFEGGDSDYPVWQPSTGEATSWPGGDGYLGLYRAVVIDNADPGDAYRLLVSVPEVLGTESTWASPSATLGDGSPLPDVGTEIWVQFESGDPSYPVWVGVD